MQFTGIQDCNGKDLYQGDIVRMESEGQYTGTAVVDWDENGGLYYFNDNHNPEGWYFDWVFHDHAQRCEVLGNLYENPELLTTSHS